LRFTPDKNTAVNIQPNPDHFRIKARSTNSLLVGAAVFNRIAEFSEFKKDQLCPFLQWLTALED
jgi:hypothetical protein